MSEPAVVAPPPKRSLKERLKAMFAEYGRIAVVTYFSLSILTIIGFSIAIGIGASPSSASGFLGVIGAGWLAAKATLPIRILITLGITPGIAAIYHRLRPPKPPGEDDDDDDDDDEDDDSDDVPAAR